MVLVELKEVCEGVVADDIRVEDKERGVVLGKDRFGELQGACSVKRLGLD